MHKHVMVKYSLHFSRSAAAGGEQHLVDDPSAFAINSVVFVNPQHIGNGGRIPLRHSSVRVSSITRHVEHFSLLCFFQSLPQ